MVKGLIVGLGWGCAYGVHTHVSSSSCVCMCAYGVHTHAMY
jgi:hypothetical protein